MLLRFTFIDKVVGEQNFDAITPVDYSDVEAPTVLNVPVHFHDQIEIIECHASGTYYLDDKVYNYNPGDIIFCQAQKMHGWVGSTRGKYEGLIIDLKRLDPNNFDAHDSELRAFYENKYAIPAVIRESDPAYESLKMRVSALRTIVKENGGRLKMWGNAYLMLSEMAEGRKRNEAPIYNEQAAAIKKSIELMEKEYGGKVTTNEISDISGLSRYHFLMAFKAIAHSSPIDYLIDIRLTNAYYFLEHGYTVTDTSNLCGFNSLSYFILKFKERYKITPHKVKALTD